MYCKAKTFNANKIASAILAEKDPGKQKGLGRKVEESTKFSEDVWRERCQGIMKVGLQAKFDQNPKLKQFLLDTRTTILVEANRKDKYWGAGMSLRDSRIWKQVKLFCKKQAC